MHKNKWWLLQLFADGGEGSAAGSDGGAAAEAGVSDEAAAHQRLRDLGVPENKIRKNRSYKFAAKAQTPAVAEQAAAPEQETEQDDAAAEKPTKEQTQRMTWDEIKADPEYSEQLNTMMRDRVKKSKAAEEAMEALTPALQALAKVYGLDPDNIDYGKLSEHLRKEDRLYDEKALEMGTSREVARKADQFDIMENKMIQDQVFRQHMQRLETQGEALKAKFPQFNLNEEMKNPVFKRMLAPGEGLVSVEEAYYAVHRKEIEQAAMKAASDQTAKNLTNAIRSGTMRPQENGAGSSAPSVSKFSYKNATREQREALKQRIRTAGARGEKIYPGQL